MVQSIQQPGMAMTKMKSGESHTAKQAMQEGQPAGYILLLSKLIIGRAVYNLAVCNLLRL